MENCCKFCGRTTKYGCTLCDNKVCVICADESKVDESGYNEENHQVGKCPRGACNNNNNNNNDSKADADDIDVKTAAAKSSKNRVGNIVSGKRVNIFNYFGTAQKGKLCVAQKMKMDTLISDINDINIPKKTKIHQISTQRLKRLTLVLKKKNLKENVHPKLVDLSPWTQKKLFQILSRGYSTTKIMTMLKIRSQKLVTGIM